MPIKSRPLVSIVDDDESIRESTSRLVKANGFKTESFASGTEFLQSPDLAQTDCLILDLRMPGMSGLELQRRLVAENRQIPVIYISAHGSPRILEETLDAGAIDFLPKPFSEESLLNAIHRALNHY